jgi:hypothetical protein
MYDFFYIYDILTNKLIPFYFLLYIYLFNPKFNFYVNCLIINTRINITKKLNNSLIYYQDCKKYIQRYITNESDSVDVNDDKLNQPEEEIKKPVEKYEDKYLNRFNLLNSCLNEDPEKIKQLRNNFIMEMTPLGNTIMYYDSERESFIYYADSILPYRYLEVVSRKYVITFNCKSLYVIMEDELKEVNVNELNINNNNVLEKQIGSRPPELNSYFNKKNSSFSKNSVPSNIFRNQSLHQENQSTSKKNNSTENKIVLKYKTNRYSYQGKIVNFSMLKKVNRKEIDKKYNLTFAEFKKLKN